MTVAPPTAERLRDAWDALADGYDAHVTPLTRRLARDLLDRVDPRPGMDLLDVAAGTGAVSVMAAQAGARVVAVDHAPQMIERLRAHARAGGLPNLDGRVMDGHALDLPDETFDVAVSLHGVALFPDVDRGLAELARVTRPGGKVVIGAFGLFHKAELFGFIAGAMRAAIPGFTPPPRDPPPLPFQLADLGVLRRKLADAGLSAVAADTTTWDTPFESAVQFWTAFASANPAWGQMTAGLTVQERAQVQQVLDGMFRERSGGAPKAVIHTEVNLGVGTK
ncbi:MAG: class I SAM-dependent methyltransferase [Micromonosporaceae bacterium]